METSLRIDLAARKIVDDIAADIQDRTGIGNEFEEIGEDIKQEMLTSWVAIAEEHIKRLEMNG